MSIRPIYAEDGRVYIIDQRLLPNDYQTIEIVSKEQMWDAIATLAVRGAPAIGVAAAYGVYLSVLDADFVDGCGFREAVREAVQYLATSRPTAVNLFWALEQMQTYADRHHFYSAKDARDKMLEKADLLCDAETTCCKNIGIHGADYLKNYCNFLTHCNAGALATSGFGTALAPLYELHNRKHAFHVFVDETRPLLQGSRLTAWELIEAGIDMTLICDNMAGWAMKQGNVDAVIVGADRIAKNGDTANKIGTYSLSVLAKEHNIPLFIAAPFSTIDFSLDSGDEIPIEKRHEDEVLKISNTYIAPKNATVYNPAFDVTPHAHIKAFITEYGVIEAPFLENLSLLK